MKKMKRRSRSEKEVVSMSLRKFREEYLKKDKDNPEDTTKLESKLLNSIFSIDSIANTLYLS